VPDSVEQFFDPAGAEAELREYLADGFELDRLWRYQHQLETELHETGDEEAFYRTSRGYLYNLTAFAMTGTKLPYLRALTAQLEPGARVLDFGCGIGADGLMLLEAGFNVEFADFNNPSIEYLRWRLARRGLDAPIHDLDSEVPDGFDAVYAFDVIEHVPDPFAFLGEMEARGRLIVLNFLAPEPDDQELHHHLPIPALLAHVAKHPLRWYRVLHGRSHLVVYESRSATVLERLVSRWRLATGRFADRLPWPDTT
jgi:ubiquinone/menaquinone biosynthesis C-methylase UbiE